MPTDQQLEDIAREYCRLMARDPEEVVWGAHPVHSTLATSKPRWQWSLDTIRPHLAIHEALRKVLDHV